MATLALRGVRLFSQGTATTVVRTKSGSLKGEQTNGVRIFRGVPFAEAPVKGLRFRPPVAAKAWTGERDATRFADAALQPGTATVSQSEDCLYLNVWAPVGKGPFPVYVWIHGGGFTGGRSFDPAFDGAKFAQLGIVCVTVAYRLGVLGFLDMEPLLGAEFAGSANNGLRDLIAALEWVKGHIGDFGGDPGRVTLGGQSAGAKLTDILAGIPAAQGLFQQMISESGGAERIWARSDAQAVAVGFGEQWRKDTGGVAGSILTAAGTKLIDVQREFTETWPKHFPLRAELDGTLIPRLPVSTIAQGSTKGKRLLLGTNREESAYFAGPHPEKNASANDLGNMPVTKFAEVYAKYKGIYPEMTVDQLRIRALTAEEYWIPSMRVLDSHVGAGGRAWCYRLDFVETSGRLKGYAYHSLDIGLTWSRPNAEVENAAAEAALAGQLHAAWAAFIRGDAPAAKGIPDWPEYRSDSRTTMILDVRSRVEQRPMEAERRLWDGVL